MAVRAFRSFVNDLRKPAPYSFVTSEARGTLNVLIGSAQIAMTPFMYCWGQKTLAERHIKIGTEALSQGATDLKIAAAAVTVLAITYYTRNIFKT